MLELCCVNAEIPAGEEGSGVEWLTMPIAG